LGSLTFNGVRFAAYVDDHRPPHLHGFYAGVEVIVEIGSNYVDLANRRRNIIPRNAKRSDVAHILNAAADHREALLKLWRTENASSRR
jgi:hypothetical protein